MREKSNHDSSGSYAIYLIKVWLGQGNMQGSGDGCLGQKGRQVATSTGTDLAPQDYALQASEAGEVGQTIAGDIVAVEIQALQIGELGEMGQTSVGDTIAGDRFRVCRLVRWARWARPAPVRLTQPVRFRFCRLVRWARWARPAPVRL